MKIAYLSIWRKKLSPLSSTSCVWRVEKRNILSWQFLNERRKKRSHLWFSESELSLNKRNFPTTFFMYIVSLAHMWCHYSYSQTTLVQSIGERKKCLMKSEFIVTFTIVHMHNQNLSEASFDRKLIKAHDELSWVLPGAKPQMFG